MCYSVDNSESSRNGDYLYGTVHFILFECMWLTIVSGLIDLEPSPKPSTSSSMLKRWQTQSPRSV